MYVALHTADPTDAGTGAEVTGGSYARLAVTFNAPSGGVCTNAALLRWDNLPASTITHFGIRDAATGGNLLYHGPLSASQAVTAGQSLELAAGQLSVALQ